MLLWADGLLWLSRESGPSIRVRLRKGRVCVEGALGLLSASQGIERNCSLPSLISCNACNLLWILRTGFLCSLALLLLCTFSFAGPFQNRSLDSSDDEHRIAQGTELLRTSHYSGAEALFRDWVREAPSNSSAHHYLALSLAFQSRLEEALIGFRQALSLDPNRSDSCFELAAVLLKLDQPAEAYRWARRGLRIEPESQYGLDLAGSLSFLLNSKNQALEYWNRLDRPHLMSMDILAPDHLDRFSVAEEIDLKPGNLIKGSELERAAWRLAQHPHIRSVELSPVPGPDPDQFSLEVRVASRSGFGNRGEFLANTFGQIAFQTARLHYWNLLGSGTSLEVPVRWNPQARWFQFSLASPRPAHLPIYTSAVYGWRDETWNLGSDNSFRLRSHQVSTSLLFPVAIPRLGAQLRLGYRWRSFDADTATADFGSPQTETGAFFVALNPSLNILKRDAPAGWRLSSDLQSELRVTRTRNPDDGVTFRTSASWESRFESSTSSNHEQSLEIGLHAGWISQQSLVEDHFMLGMGPDTDFALRAHRIFRDGGKGLSPVAGRFALVNLSWRREIRKVGLLGLGLVVFTDVAKVGRSLAGQPDFDTIVDTGAGVELGWGPLRSNRLTVAYGRDWKGKRNTLYVGTRFP